jgi:hypothetical protein
MNESPMPAWLDRARWYYTEIGEAHAQPVSVYDVSHLDEISGESPGTLCLHLEPRYRYSPKLRVLDAGGREAGKIHGAGLVPGVRYVMSRDGEPVWTLLVRSVVRKHHVLKLTQGDSWTFDTPWFWWQHLTGTALGVPRLLGCIGPVAWVWVMRIEPGRDTLDVLAAVAFMHRQWFHM